MDVSNWGRSESWRQRGNNFMVEINRHEKTGDDFQGPQRWCVYAYIYPNHPSFETFVSDGDMWQDACQSLPLHSGPSYFRTHRTEKGEVCSHQVGADYNHLHDTDFTFAADPESAWKVFRDAQELFERLNHS